MSKDYWEVANVVGLATEYTEILSFFLRELCDLCGKESLAHPFSHSPLTHRTQNVPKVLVS